MSAIDKEQFPKPALYAAAALIAFSIIGAGTMRWMSLNAPADAVEAAPATIAAAPLFFTDEESGAVLVHHQDGRLLARYDVGEGGFIRGVMRAFTRERRSHGIGREQPFLLSVDAEGTLAMTDATTGLRVNLNAFGKDNRAAFAQLLVASGAI